MISILWDGTRWSGIWDPPLPASPSIIPFFTLGWFCSRRHHYYPRHLEKVVGLASVFAGLLNFPWVNSGVHQSAGQSPRPHSSPPLPGG